ncbi:MMPL family transporter [Aeromicrobium fastidiosum]|uniref:MMPL family transporter n=1 Tax=Aeromicrobium fastidiosum TaxID=52699 RepID=A0A641AJ84_9ACTN|nr:MMPL family transporter [Aeromicrobium fastidiosum]KAA1374937.1 MMPL family transporter [Aeromicrobium fastidiosum]MBP2390490.1 RND superfamily putative drug exporter [Aeromicrobium fastidiosum]
MSRPPSPRRASTVRVARWSATHPWRAIGGWFALVAVAVALSSLVPGRTLPDDSFRVGESGRAAAMLDDAGLVASPTESVLITAPSGPLDLDRASSVATQVSRAATDVKGVSDVGPPVVSPKKDAVLVPIEMTGDAETAADHVGALIRATERVQEDHPELDVQQAGAASLDAGVNDKVGEDLATAETSSLPITFLIMLVAFGAFIAAGIPVLLAITSVVTALGLYAPLSYLAPDSGSVANIVLLIGMAVGVDYSLFYLKREREERQRGRSTIDAVEIAAATAGRAVVVSGFAVMVAMSGLFLSGEPVFTSIAAGAIIVVLVAIVGSLTVLPAMLVAFGRFVDRPRIPLLWRLNRRIGTGGISSRLVGPVVRRPFLSAALAVGALVALAVPALGMSTHQSTVDALPQDIPAVQAFQRVQQSFPSEHPTFEVVLKTTRGGADAARSALGDIAADAVSSGVTDAGDQDVRASKDGRTLALTMSAAHRDGDPRNDRAVEQLRDVTVRNAVRDLPGVTSAVGGGVAETYDYEHQTSRLPLVIGFVLALTALMMMWTFRNLTLALITTALNLLSVGAAFGVLTLVFQHSWADGLLGYTSSGFVVDWIPLFCFVVLVGLSMDYHVFVLSRVREGLRRGLPYEAAVEHGVRDTASVVTSAAAVMVSVFAVFATLDLLEMKQMGVGLSVAILLDATVVRLVLLPALLLGFKGRLQGLGDVRRTEEDDHEPEPAGLQPA